MNHKIIKISNLYIANVAGIMGGWELDAPHAASRRRFIRTLKPFIADLEIAQNELREKYGTKNEKGDLKVNDKGIISFTPENRKLFNKDWEALHDELISIDVTPANEIDLERVKKTICEQQVKFIEEKKNAFDEQAFEYSSVLEEIAKFITPIEVDRKGNPIEPIEQAKEELANE